MSNLKHYVARSLLVALFALRFCDGLAEGHEAVAVKPPFGNELVLSLIHI